MNRTELLDQLTDLITSFQLQRPIRVAIDGIDCSGKTTLANELAERIQKRGREVIRASIDSFHNPRGIRYRQGNLSPEGYYFNSFDYPELKKSLLIPLGGGGSREYITAQFDVRSDSIVKVSPESAPDDAILILDGIFLQRPELQGYLDFAIFVDIDFDECIRRAKKRDRELMGDAAEVEKRYRMRYIPGQELYIEEADPKSKADVVIKNDDPTDPGLEIR